VPEDTRGAAPHAATGEEALARLATEPAELVVLDIACRGSTGSEGFRG
jgi:DNA-binding response OmpR family regulator